MPVFRSKVRRRPARVQTRRRTSTRWAPPGYSPAAGVTINLATFSDTFSETTLATWWRDSAVTYPAANRTPVTPTGNGLLFNPDSGKFIEIRGTYPFDLSRKSVTFDLSIDPDVFTMPDVYIELALIRSPWTLVATGWAVDIQFYKSGSDYIFDVQMDDNTFQQSFVVTSTAGWRFIRVTSDITTPTDVTIYRSPDGYDWTQILTGTITINNIGSLALYAWGNAD